MRSVLQDWVMELGLRHQGVLVAAIRGYDGAAKHDPSKLFTRCLRNMILNCHCGDAKKASSFIEEVSHEELKARFDAFKNCFDHYNVYYVFHLLHAMEVIGYYHPSPYQRARWLMFYQSLCHKLHVAPETMAAMDLRLNASEDLFAKMASV